MRFVLINNQFLHNKNLEGLRKMMSYLKWDYKETTNQNEGDIIYCPEYPIEQIEGKKYIYGPHFSVFPNYLINGINKENSVYIMPSKWALNSWNSVFNRINMEVLTFPVNVERFNEKRKLIERIHDEESEIFIYYKRRNPEELLKIVNFIENKGIKYKIFDYERRYYEEEYINCLRNSKYGIIVDAHESQGFAIEEALSCNVPLLVWNVKTMDQEFRSNYPKFECTTVPYWDERCGELFTEYEELEETYNKFIEKLEMYKPREYIIENLSVGVCADKLINIINNL